jgi:hypothetical protein
MSDRPTGANGKRNQAWGTTHECPACGECLCFKCHPHGPCVDEHTAEREGRPAYQAALWQAVASPGDARRL